MSSSGTVFTYQTLLTSLRIHMHVGGGVVEEWLEGGDTGELSRNLGNGSLFGA